MTANNTVAQCMVQISPTYLSTDLLSPKILHRATFPSIRYTKLRRKETSWGNDVTKYGGIGKLPFLGETSLADGKVILSRSHRHFKSGVNTYHAPSQPYAVTLLTLAGSRKNDELLPMPLITTNEKDITMEEPWPEHLRNLFTSHICQFDVFPRFDPGRTQFDVACPRTVTQEISATTENALDKLSDAIYRTTHYQNTFLPWKASKGVTRILPGINRVQEYDKKCQVSRTCDNKENKKTVLRKKKKFLRNETGEIIGEVEVETDDEEEDECLDKTEGKGNGSLEASNPTNPTKRSISPSLESTDTRTNESSTAVWPLWPPGLDNITNYPPGYPKILLPHFLPSRLAKVPGYNSSESIRDYSMNNPDTLKPNQRLAVRFGTNPDHGFLEAVSCSQGESKGLNATPGGSHWDYRLPSIGKNSGELPRGVTKDGYSNLYQKPSLPAMVGMKFKRDAHRKYHKTYPELVPDLRDSTVSGKRHFFFGANACVLR